jgi:hypothetical protein
MMTDLVAQATPDVLVNVSQMGLAGLMGGLWWWERKYSRQREDQLTEAHQRVMDQKTQLDVLLNAVRENTAALTRLATIHEEMAGRVGKSA